MVSGRSGTIYQKTVEHSRQRNQQKSTRQRCCQMPRGRNSGTTFQGDRLSSRPQAFCQISPATSSISRSNRRMTAPAPPLWPQWSRCLWDLQKMLIHRVFVLRHGPYFFQLLSKIARIGPWSQMVSITPRHLLLPVRSLPYRFGMYGPWPVFSLPVSS